MKQICYSLIAGLLFSASACRTAPAEAPVAKQKLMWLDCSANWERFSDPDSIRYYAAKCREAGMTALVLDMKGTSSEVVWPSDEAPQLKEWKGVVRPDFDFVGTFIRAARDNGLEIYGSFNTFAEGHGIFRRGLIYEHPEWQSVNYIPGKGLVPQLEIPGKSVLFTNPALPEVQEHEIALFTEVARRYDLDGILLDRGRYDNIQSDFSDFSRRAFEAYIGQPVERFPEDIYAWEPDGEGGWKRTDGPWFKKWIEWRAGVIKSFVEESHAALKAINPDLRIGDYTGAWYPTYYYVGVNWASTQFDPAEYFDWATPEYRNTGYAELLDVYMTGLYYTLVTKDEVDRANGTVGRRTEAGMTDEQSYWYCVEGGAEWARRLTCGAAPLIGSLYVEQYDGDAEQFGRAVAEALRQTDGLMIFDVMHIIKRDWWQPLAEGIAAAETSK